MSNDPVQQRKEAKPVKLFSISAVLWDDGCLSGSTCTEIRNIGRSKNQKCIVPGHDEFLSCVRSLVPSVMPAIEPLAQQVYDDMEVEDSEHCEKIGKFTVDVYNDGFLDVSCGEIVQGQRGAPKTWLMEPRDFLEMVEARVGQLTAPFTPLIENRGSTLVDTSATSEALLDDATNLDEDESSGYVGEVDLEEEEDAPAYMV
jgi:hypothetical protein